MQAIGYVFCEPLATNVSAIDDQPDKTMRRNDFCGRSTGKWLLVIDFSYSSRLNPLVT